MMQDESQKAIGRRVRAARHAAGLTQEELSGLIGRSVSWMEGVEAGRMPLDRFSVICSIAEVCDVDPVWILGQPYRLRNDGGTSGHAYIPALRTVLRRSGLILSGHPGLVPTSGPAELSSMRTQAGAVNRARQGAALPGAASVLPGLLEELNTALLTHEGGAEREQALRLMVDASRNARQTLNALGYPDLAWVAAEVAAGAAKELDDPISKAAVAWDRCGAMLHHGSLRETEAIAQAALTDLEPLVSSGSSTGLALHGALLLRQVIASARMGNKTEAWQHTREAWSIAERLPEDYHDLAYQTVFGRPNVAVHAAEVGVELEEPDKGLRFVPEVNVSTVPSRERLTHYRIDEARAFRQMGKSAAAVATLRKAAAHAPHYVYANPMARALAADLVRTGVPSQSAALSGLVRNMELVV
ncbi:helix-turn-helix domain-containing protein [Streptomyces sp. NPDC056501]|uniref:helix-turn-helix domain-containing protein n=1 Tax=Streptomyces sp. NPDC056501 TaxID=3345841 RepID=UPI0036A66C03